MIFLFFCLPACLPARPQDQQSQHLKIALHVCLYLHDHLAYQVNGCSAAPAACARATQICLYLHDRLAYQVS